MDVKPCPHPEKLRFELRKDVNRQLLHMWRSGDPKFTKMRAYFCQCGVWHMTSKNYEENEK